MDGRTIAPAVAAITCALVAALVIGPYLLLPAGAVGTYYGAGAITPLAAGLLAVVGLIVFASGWAERSDPVLTAGAGVTIGGFLAVVAVLWAVTVPRSVVTQLSRSTLVGYHRSALALAAVVVLLAAGWYARSLEVF